MPDGRRLTTRIDLLALRRRLWNDEARTPLEERSRRSGWIASASVAEVAYLLAVHDLAEDIAGALELAASKSEQLEAELTAWGIPLNDLLVELRRQVQPNERLTSV